MEDRFRFRVFYKPHNKIYNVICLNSDRQKEIIIEYKNSTALVEWKNCDILQCTGLKDKNGKLIFEGDVLKDVARQDKPLYVVKWNENQGNYYIKMLNPRKYELYDEWNLGRHDLDYEIIENIYETPELIKEGE